jgi:hypothetical protein
VSKLYCAGTWLTLHSYLQDLQARARAADERKSRDFLANFASRSTFAQELKHSRSQIWLFGSRYSFYHRRSTIEGG